MTSAWPVQAGKPKTLGLSDLPLFLLQSVPPNLVLSFDDSGSMLWGYLPDSIQSNATALAARSGHYNKMYYDPDVSYRPAVDAVGQSLGNGLTGAAYSEEADFTNAATNIFNYGNPGDGSTPVQSQRIDLATSFRPPWNLFGYTGSFGPSFSATAQAAHYYVYDASNIGCDTANVLDDTCYDRVDVSSSSGPSRVRPELGSAVSTDERTNFANWFQFYSYRMLAGKSVLSLAFAPKNLSSNIRVARQTINQRGPKSGDPSTGGENNGGSSYVQAMDTTQRPHFYNWLFNVAGKGNTVTTGSSGTPLRQALRDAGEFYREDGDDSPYVIDPGGVSPDNKTELSCRLNAHIMVSDGYWNGSAVYPDGFDEDHQSTNLPDSTTYNPAAATSRIYADANAGSDATLADLAFHYWANDLRDKLTNNVQQYQPVDSGDAIANYWNPVNDPANWQHMVNYTIAFGIAGEVPLTTTAYDALIAGTSFTNESGTSQTGWTSVGLQAGRADDLYHTAINSRGQYFSASDPDTLVNSLASVMNAIADRESSAASIDLNTGSISAGAAVFQSKFSTDGWTGNVVARPISDGSGTGDPCNSNHVGTVCDTPIWEAASVNTTSSLFPSGIDQRKVFSYDPSASVAPGSRGIRFQATSGLTATQLSAIGQGDTTEGALRVPYLRGSAALEQQNGGPYRNRRTSRLGAVVHSSPVFVSDGFSSTGVRELFIPDDLEGSGSQTHADFLCTNPQDTDGDLIVDQCSSGIRGRTPMLFVGSNDGMVHAYNASTTGSGAGTELFSYVPNAVIDNLYRLTAPTFTHASYVDGEIEVTDVYYAGAWHTALVGGLRAGGQGFYALDVTDADSITAESDVNADSLVRWEFGDTNTVSGLSDGDFGANGDRDLGYSYSKPAIVKVNYNGVADGLTTSGTGRWVAVFGNGYNAIESDGSASTTGRAYLYIVDIETGTLIKKIDTGVGTDKEPNGLATPSPVLNDDDFTADYVYAGDLYGNMWKFDISSNDIADWGVAYSDGGSPAPLFVTKDGGEKAKQPMISTPTVAAHPSGLGGNMIYFGTGRYLEASDNTSDELQAFYGIWDQDQCVSGSATVDCASLAAGSAKTHSWQSDLKLSELLEQKITDEGTVQRVTTNKLIDWYDGTDGHLGWYLPLRGSKEVGERAVGRPVVRGRLIVFSTIIPDADPCDAGGDSWLMVLNRSNGGRPPSQVLDHTGDGELDSSDYYSGKVTSGTRGTINDEGSGVYSDPAILRCKNGADCYLVGSSNGGTQSGILYEGVVPGRYRWRQLQ